MNSSGREPAHLSALQIIYLSFSCPDGQPGAEEPQIKNVPYFIPPDAPAVKPEDKERPMSPDDVDIPLTEDENGLSAPWGHEGLLEPDGQEGLPEPEGQEGTTNR